MTIYTITDDLLIKEEVFENIMNYDAFMRELDEIYIDGWYSDIEDAEEMLLQLKEENNE